MPEVRCEPIETCLWHNYDGSFSFSSVADIWRIKIPGNIGLLQEFERTLSPDELLRAVRYQDPKDKNRFIINRVGLRMLLGKYLDKSPADIRFADGPNKKPILLDPGPADIHYNVSHSGDWIIIAISGYPVGIDIERIDGTLEFGEILPLCFNIKEVNTIRSSADARHSFYDLWTRKEALLKATSRGIDDDIINIPCLNGTHRVSKEKIGSNENWTVTSFQIDDQYSCSVAYRDIVNTVNFYEFDSPVR